MYGFEDGMDGSPIADLLKGAEHIDIRTVLDNGVTEGRHCARIMIPKGRTGYFLLEPGKTKDWGGFDYFAMDVYSEDADRLCRGRGRCA